MMWDKIATCKIANKSSKNMAEFRCLEMTLTDQNYMHEEIESRLNSSNGYYFSGHTFLSSHLLCENIQLNVYLILLFVLYGCETWAVTLTLSRRSISVLVRTTL
jgi:hypothetical protein